MVICWDIGLTLVHPVFISSVTLYVPFARFVNLYEPSAPVIVLFCMVEFIRVIFQFGTPLPVALFILNPEMLNVDAGGGIGVAFSCTVTKEVSCAVLFFSSSAVTEMVAFPHATSKYCGILCPVNTEPVVKHFSVAIDQLYEILLPHEPTGLAVNVKFVLTFILCVAGLAVMETVGGGVDVS